MHPENLLNKVFQVKNRVTGRLEQIPVIGQLPYRMLGVRKETDRISWFPTLVTQATFKLYCDSIFHHVDVIGELPREGLAFAVSNHKEAGDILKGAFAGMKLAGRMFYTLSRKTMLDPDYEEPEKYRKDDFLYKAPRWLRSFGAYVMRGVGSIPVRRGEISLETIRGFNQAVKDEVLIAIFPQETRQKDGSLRGMKGGAAYFITKHPQMPIYPIAMFCSPEGKDTVRVGRRLILEEILHHPSFRNDLDQRAAISLFIADEIADMFPYEPRRDWFEKIREEYIQTSIKKPN